jgi:hypothetical protein
MSKLKRRIFTFGCSFTSYAWPTWADLLGEEVEHYENWGLSGIGNRAIAERVVEAHVKNKFTKDDIVIVQWTTHLRHDFYNQSPTCLPDRLLGWKTSGSIFNYHNIKIYDQKWLDTFFFEPAYLMHTFNHIALTQGLLESTGCTWFMTSIGDVRNMGADIEDGLGHGETLLLTAEERGQSKLAWKKIPELETYERLWTDYADHWLEPISYTANRNPEGFFWFQAKDDKNPWKETHPSPRQHNIWLQEQLKPRINLPVETTPGQKLIIDSIDQLHRNNKHDKRKFDHLLQLAHFEKPSHFLWPRNYLGY